MSLTNVLMSEDVWLTCVTHALTTETEEIMGLLLGDIQQANNGSVTAMIWGASPQMRSDRRKDRVETNPELLAAASAQAEKMTIATGKTTRVIGWYHSHPHITVLPSHVDVRTQAMYQLLDPGFIGLIFSCYSEDAQKVGRIQVIAFQSLDGRQRHVKPTNSNSVIEVESSLSTSDNVLSTSISSLNDHREEDSGDSRATKAAKVGGKSSDFGETSSHLHVSQFDREKTKSNPIIPYNVDSSHSTTIDIDSISDSMQEALHRSNLEVSGAEYSRKEVPLQVLPSRNLLNLETPLKSFADMQRVLFEEEKSAYNEAILHNMCDGKMHPLTFIHHTSTYQASICKLMEFCLTPAIKVLQDRLRENETRLTMLMEEAKLLEVEASTTKGNVESPRHLTTPGRRNSPAVGQKDFTASSSPTAQRNAIAIWNKSAPN